MSSIGPQLPPQPTKRKHNDYDDESTSSSKHPRRDDAAHLPRNQDEIDINGSGSDSDDDYGPPRPSTLPAAPAPRSVGPSLPPHLAAANNEDEINLSDSDSDPLPQPPLPAAASTPHNQNPDSGSSDDDDDFGPSLPSASAPRRQIGPSLPPSDLDNAPKRDEWMLAPPPSSSTFSERDTTKIRARKFASKPSAKASASAPGAPSIWTETPEEKLKRLQDAVLGRTSASSSAEAGGGDASELQRKKQLRDEALAADIQAQRGRTLLEEHQGGKKKAGAVVRPEEEEDDPSKRAFDREKDMAVGGRITATQRKELINKSANFGGRFQKGSFL
ncbi:hypothetical protein MKX08_009028 [Trichoderma sp. CBMAI-0020]|nr:hypothetical protein MKX08_009028 [Trichoderma sp. CBMAI-0020]